MTNIPYQVTADLRDTLEFRFKAGGQTVTITIGKTDCQDPDCQMEILGVEHEEGD